MKELTQQELLEIYGGDGGKKRGIKVGDIIIYSKGNSIIRSINKK